MHNPISFLNLFLFAQGKERKKVLERNRVVHIFPLFLINSQTSAFPMHFARSAKVSFLNSILHKNKRDYFFVCFYGHKERLVMSENLFLSFLLLLLLSWWQFSKNFRGIKCWIIVHLNSVLRHKNSRHKLLELFVLNNAGIMFFVFQHSNIVCSVKCGF